MGAPFPDDTCDIPPVAVKRSFSLPGLGHFGGELSTDGSKPIAAMPVSSLGVISGRLPGCVKNIMSQPQPLVTPDCDTLSLALPTCSHFRPRPASVPRLRLDCIAERIQEVTRKKKLEKLKAQAHRMGI